MSLLRERYRLIATRSEDRKTAFARDVCAGLRQQPKRLSCRYFYDHIGSQLFEAICDLPEYYLTRAEREILQAHADELAARVARDTVLVELGSGSAAKTRLLIDALLRRHGTLQYVPVDISKSALEDSSRELMRDFPTLEVLGLATEYEEGLLHLRKELRGPKLILWLGSNVGNFDRPAAAEFLQRVRAAMNESDRLLAGIDLRKDRAMLEPAYDDAQGITARFNLNLLTRINRELGGHFDLATFRHHAIYQEEAGRIEMYLVSQQAQRVRIDNLDMELSLEAGEAIHTENSYKYSLPEIEGLAAAASLRGAGQWFDSKRRFSLNLFAPV